MKLRLLSLLAIAAMGLATAAGGLAQTAPSGGATAPPAPLPNTNRTEAPTITPGKASGSPVPAPTISSSVTAAPESAGNAAGKRGRRGSPAPSPSGSPAPGASPTDTPAPPQFVTLDGVWEVQLQTRTKTFYSHLRLKQAGDAAGTIDGQWNRESKKLPLSGTFDGRVFAFTVKDGTTSYALAGYIENFSDMVGIVTSGATKTPFTASHRKRERNF